MELEKFTPLMTGFISSKYTSLSPALTDYNIDLAVHTGREVAAKGYNVLIPHALFRHWERDGRFSYEYMIKMCLTHMKRCDFVVLAAENEEKSKGVMIEIEFCHSIGIPIFASYELVPLASQWDKMRDKFLSFEGKIIDR